MIFIDANNKKTHDYVTYPRQYDSFRWWKPLFTILLTLLFYIIFTVILVLATGVGDFMRTGGDIDSFTQRFSGGYDNMVVTDVTGVIVNLGSVVMLLPALILAQSIVRDRSFQSFSSSRGGWNHWVFFRCLIVALLTCALPILIDVFYFEEHGAINNQFSKPALILLCILCPLQCIAEEYIFRGLAMQTLGAWLRVPLIAVVIQAAGFAAMHPYNRIGQITIFISGLTMGLAAWFGRGIEVSSALHIVNNMVAFLLSGFGVTKISSEVKLEDMYLDILVGVLYVGIIMLLRYKTNWFNKGRYDDAVEWNEDRAEKKARKAAIKQAKRDRKAAKKAARKSH